LRIHEIDAPELMRRLIADAVQPSKTHHVVTANAQFYNLAEQSREFRNCVAQAEYACADGISVVLACRWLGKSKVPRIAGVDLVEGLCAHTALSGFSVYFLGGNEGSAEMAAVALSRKYPGFTAAGICCPPRGFEANEVSLRPVLEDIKRVKPSILFVALGAPRQELFIHQHIRSLDVPVAIGVGGSFEMLAGRIPRAPGWMQSLGLEWAYRWSREPVRLTPRYLVGNPLFCFYVLRHLLTGHRDTPQIRTQESSRD
jgi:N-acetylglucosaminyldiphosphoundecaprenol N-acetyl-beta-D-mannosaminyltransferase